MQPLLPSLHFSNYTIWINTILYLAFCANYIYIKPVQHTEETMQSATFVYMVCPSCGTLWVRLLAPGDIIPEFIRCSICNTGVYASSIILPNTKVGVYGIEEVLT